MDSSDRSDFFDITEASRLAKDMQAATAAACLVITMYPAVYLCQQGVQE